MYQEKEEQTALSANDSVDFVNVILKNVYRVFNKMQVLKNS